MPVRRSRLSRQPQRPTMIIRPNSEATLDPAQPPVPCTVSPPEPAADPEPVAQPGRAAEYVFGFPAEHVTREG